MKIASVQSYGYLNQKKSKIKLHDVKQQNNQPAFYGIKGAGIGALGGLAYLGAVALISGPLMPITTTIVLASAGAGALAGNGIENEFKKKD